MKSFEKLVEKLLDEVDMIADDSRRYEGLIYAAQRVREHMKIQRDPLDEALNMGDGVYRP